MTIEEAIEAMKLARTHAEMAAELKTSADEAALVATAALLEAHKALRQAEATVISTIHANGLVDV